MVSRGQPLFPPSVGALLCPKPEMMIVGMPRFGALTPELIPYVASGSLLLSSVRIVCQNRLYPNFTSLTNCGLMIQL